MILQIVIISFVYLILCGLTTKLFHERNMEIGDGPHILFAIMFWPITLPCMLGYKIPTYISDRLGKKNK